MIRIEDLRNAISAISAVDPEIGYSLRELLAANQIGLPVDDEDARGDGCFLFNGSRVYVRSVSFFSHGIEPLEERLVLKYGELAARYEMDETAGPMDYFSAVRQIREKGLDCLVRFELKRAIKILQKKLDDGAENKKVPEDVARMKGLMDILNDSSAEGFSDENQLSVLFSAEIDTNTHVHFLPFPFSFAVLKQAAEINLEFFHLRFLIDQFVTGKTDLLYAGMTRGRLTGLMLMEEKRHLFYAGFEIKYIATINGVPLDSETVEYPRIRGVGTFLMAGAWLIWKQSYPELSEMCLDAEHGAGPFYAGIGFDLRPPFGYVLKRPKGKLLLFVVEMATSRSKLPQRAQKSVIQCIEREVRYLKKSTPASDIKRKSAILIVASCLRQRRNKAVAEATQNLVKQYRRKIPEAGLLLESLATPDSMEAVKTMFSGAGTVPVVCDPVFEQHLEGIFHMESTKRVKVLESILAEEPFPERVARVVPRAASEVELAWVHAPDYIEKIANTEGVKLSSLDPDTQTTPQSYATAKLAVGGVFSLIDTVYMGDSGQNGVAFIRPPGHHAEAGTGMGFCLFNNVALGAEYAMRCHGAERVLIVDIDIHHGNGTQSIFYDNPDVLFFSTHQFPLYPGTGKLGEIGTGAGNGYTINVPLQKGYGDMEYAKIFHFLLFPVARDFKPDIILVSLGFDLYHTDPLGQMDVSPDGYALMTHMLKKLAAEICHSRLVFVMEGGYSIEGIKSCGRRLLQELAGIPTLSQEKIQCAANENPKSPPELKKAIDVHKENWPSLRV